MAQRAGFVGKRVGKNNAYGSVSVKRKQAKTNAQYDIDLPFLPPLPMSSPFSSFAFLSCLRSVRGNRPNVRVRYCYDGNVASVMVRILPFLPYWVLTVSSRSCDPGRDVTLLYNALNREAQYPRF